MHNGCLQAAKSNRKQPRWKLLPSLTESNRAWHMTSTPMCASENSKMLWPGVGEDPQDLITCIKTLMDCCKMVNDEHCKHELHCRVVHAYCHEGKLLGKHMAKPFKTPSSELADIMVNHFTIQHAQKQVSHSTKPVDAICHDRCWAAHTSHNSNGHTPSATSKDCPNWTWQHPASRTNYPTCDSCCSKCDKMGHWGPKCHGGKPLQPRNAPHQGLHSQLGHSMGSLDAHLGTTITTLGGVAKQMP